jgi:HK97 family phage prohead protease
MGDQLEFRDATGGSITPRDPEKRVYAARILNYNQVDSHGTSWAPGVFEESLQRKLPKSVWSHDPRRPIGKVIGYHDDGTGLDVLVQYADPDAVPDARMAHSLQKDGIIDEYSFAFLRQDDEPDPDNPGAVRITKADIREVSPVLVGSGKGTGTLGVRSDATLNRADADELLRRVAIGELDARTALQELASKREAPTVEVRWEAGTADALVATVRAQFPYDNAEEITNGEGVVIGLRAKLEERDETPEVTEPDPEIDAELRALEAMQGEAWD